MAQLHRNMTAVAVVVTSLCLTLMACAAETTVTDGGNPELEQAARAVAAAGRESVAGASNDQEAVRRAMLSLNIIDSIGELGGINASPQIEQLMDDLRGSLQPQVIETIVQIQFSNKQRQWLQMNTISLRR
jgi:hypothetical protein